MRQYVVLLFVLYLAVLAASPLSAKCSHRKENYTSNMSALAGSGRQLWRY